MAHSRVCHPLLLAAYKDGGMRVSCVCRYKYSLHFHPPGAEEETKTTEKQAPPCPTFSKMTEDFFFTVENYITERCHIVRLCTRDYTKTCVALLCLGQTAAPPLRCHLLSSFGPHYLKRKGMLYITFSFAGFIFL